MSGRKKIVSGVGWSFIQNAASRLLSFGVFALLGRLLMPQDFGLVALAQAIIELLLVFLDQGSTTFLVYRDDVDDSHRSTALWTSVGLATIFAVAILVSAPWIGELTRTPEVTPIVRWLSLSLVIQSTAAVPTALLIREFRFRVLALRTTLAATVGGAVGITAAFQGAGAYALVAQVLSSQLVSSVTLWTESKWRPTLEWSLQNAKEQLRYGFGIIGATMVRAVSTRLDSLIIAPALGAVTLGVYTVGRRIMQICSSLLGKSGDAVALSTFSRLKEGDQEREDAYHTALSFSLFVAAPAFVGLGVTAADVVPVLLGDQWHRSVPVLQVFCIAGILMSPGYVNSSMLKAVGRAGTLLFIQLAMMLTFLAFLFPLLERGASGVAMAYTASLAVGHPIQMWLVGKRGRIRQVRWLRTLWEVGAPTALMGGAVWLTRAELLELSVGRAGRVALCSFVGLVTYPLSARLLAPRLFRSVMNVVRSLSQRKVEPK